MDDSLATDLRLNGKEKATNRRSSYRKERIASADQHLTVKKQGSSQELTQLHQEMEENLHR